MISHVLVLLSSRMYTLIHYVAFLDTERKEPKPEKQEEYISGKKVMYSLCTATVVTSTATQASDSIKVIIVK